MDAGMFPASFSLRLRFRLHRTEELIRDSLDLGRPDRVSLLFPRRHRISSRTPVPPHGYRTRRSHIKQYFKEDRALRTETTINDPEDFEVRKGLNNKPWIVLMPKSRRSTTMPKSDRLLEKLDSRVKISHVAEV
jgi:hypothetical protein